MNLDAFEITSVDDIIRGAAALRDLAEESAKLRVAPSDDITSKFPMIDGDGRVLAATVFDWDSATQPWWEDMHFLLNDSFFHACRTTSEPFWANAKGAWERDGRRMLPNNDFSDYQHSMRLTGSSACIAVPVHMPFGQTGVVAFHALDGRDELADELRLHGRSFYAAGHVFIESYARVNRAAKLLAGGGALSRHEVSCLRWVAMGKTDEEIALITQRSRATIRFHLQNAATKLGTVNRAQSLFKAGQLGYINAIKSVRHS